ncbi:hypothetical protein IV454_22750 [Massilia antarctica]|uniref:Uncharacterized protein n=1 Tax=Massilia antarctica TaxID=2765360 RepID=A0AA48WBQ8_9BURK|nr:hypothetical protein [Massilia antarctica]QPI48340.1 hypothetical protein IV454_22750 [Massilia antarctica]
MIKFPAQRDIRQARMLPGTTFLMKVSAARLETSLTTTPMPPSFPPQRERDGCRQCAQKCRAPERRLYPGAIDTAQVHPFPKPASAIYLIPAVSSPSAVETQAFSIHDVYLECHAKIEERPSTVRATHSGLTAERRITIQSTFPNKRAILL